MWKSIGGDIMIDPEKMMTGLFKEINTALKNMSKAKTVEDKLAHSEVVKNLCESLGVFLDFANNMMPFDMDDE
jgi:hypothetical protein